MGLYLRGGRIGGHFGPSPTMAAVDPFRPGRIILLRGSGEPRQRITVVPGHPFRRVLLQLLWMPQQLREVIECIDVVELTGVNQLTGQGRDDDAVIIWRAWRF